MGEVCWECCGTRNPKHADTCTRVRLLLNTRFHPRVSTSFISPIFHSIFPEQGGQEGGLVVWVWWAGSDVGHGI